MRALFGIRIEVMGGGEAVPGPVIVLVRHASIVDNLLSANLIARPHRIRLRYVLKRELLADPCLDVAGRRLPNYFVRRGTGEARELERVRALANGLGSDEGVLICPEGTRFTPERRARAIGRIAERDPQLAAGPSASATCCRRDSAASGRCSTAPRRRQSRPRRPSRPRLSEQAFFQSNRAVDVDLGFASKRTH